MDAEKTMDLSEAYHSAVEDSPEEVEDTSVSEPSADEEVSEEQKEETQINEDLEKDEEFQKVVPKDFSQNKDWKKLYYNKKQAERDLKSTSEKVEELQKQLDELAQNNQLPDLDETQLVEIAKQKGFVLSKAEAKEMVEDANDLQGMLSKIENPSEREWWSNYANANKKAMMNEFEEKYGDTLKEAQHMVLTSKMIQSENKAKQYIDELNEKHGLNISFEKDVDPMLSDMIEKSNGKFTPQNTDIYKLTRDWVADNGIGFGKKISEKAQRELNEKKKQANIETEPITSAPKTDDAGKSLRQIMSEVTKAEGGF